MLSLIISLNQTDNNINNICTLLHPVVQPGHIFIDSTAAQVGGLPWLRSWCFAYTVYRSQGIPGADVETELQSLYNPSSQWAFHTFTWLTATWPSFVLKPPSCVPPKAPLAQLVPHVCLIWTSEPHLAIALLLLCPWFLTASQSRLVVASLLLFWAGLTWVLFVDWGFSGTCSYKSNCFLGSGVATCYSWHQCKPLGYFSQYLVVA